MQLKNHIVLVTGALGTLGSAMCEAIETAGGKAIRSDLAARGNVDAYNASKGAVRLLSKSVALYGARKRPSVRCNSVHPAFIDGDMVDSIVRSRPDHEKARAKLQAQIPIGRLGQPHEVANTVVW